VADILPVREAMRAAEANLDAESKLLDQLLTELHKLPLIPKALREDFQKQKIDPQLEVIDAKRAVFNASVATYKAAAAADPMQAADPGLPLLLLPIRIETAWFPTPAGQLDLVVRIYPDDIHVDTHEPELTAEELAAGADYWRSVWGAGSNRKRLDAAWKAILQRLKPARAAWAVRAIMPSVPRPVDEVPFDQPQPEPPLTQAGSRPGAFNRPAQTTLLPDFWRVVGLNTDDDSELFYAEGSPIPKTLDLSFAPAETIPSDAPDDLPFHPEGRWLVDLEAAIKAGMALRIPLPPAVAAGGSLRLFVLGVNVAVPPGEFAARLESALVAHQYTNGLAFLPAGSPTNNTSQTRSAWQSAPNVPVPAEAEAARSAYRAGSSQNAAIAAAALGIDGSVDLCVSPDALLDERSDVAAIQQFLWPATAGKSLSWLYTKWDIPLGGNEFSWVKNIDFGIARALENHAGRWVRSRGTLPTLRIGNQPYGLLPALSLDGWVTPPDDPLATLVRFLKTLRPYWGAATTPYVRIPPDGKPDPEQQDPDATVVSILNRLPVSNGIQVRGEANPIVEVVDRFPVAPIPAMPFNSEYNLASPEITASPLPIRVVDDAVGDLNLLRHVQQFFHDLLAVLEQEPGKGIAPISVLPDPPPVDLFLGLITDSFVDPVGQENFPEIDWLELTNGSEPFDPLDPANAAQLKALNQILPPLRDFVSRLDALCNTNPAGWEGVIHEALDVFSHRLDAWITSLAARRLDEMRAVKPSGVVLGAFGWVENLTVPDPAQQPARSDQQYIHAPSMRHAATAAVLRAGYDDHQRTGPLAVNLTSSRIRNADWLASGIRSGQTLGALLGYRFERGLHEAGSHQAGLDLNHLIAPLRKAYPLPQVSAPPDDADPRVTGPVVDGLQLARNRNNVSNANVKDLNLKAEEEPALQGLLDDLADVLDSFGDLLLAESVHHLVTGNLMRAGLTADAAGRGEPLPDRFEVAITPRSARALQWHLGALLPSDFRSGATGWRTDRPRAITEPHADAWAAAMLSNAGGWKISCTLTTADGQDELTVTPADLGLCALDVVAESSGEPSQLELRIQDFVSGGLPDGSSVTVSQAENADNTPGFGELIGLTGRMRNVLAKGSPLRPEHLQGPGTSTTAGIDLNELDTRLGLLETSLAASALALKTAAEALDAAVGADDATVLTAVGALRRAMMAVADQGVPAAWPKAGTSAAASTVSALSAQSASLIGALAPLANTPRPAPPGEDADGNAIAVWVREASTYAQGIIGSSIPILPVYTLPAGSTYAVAFGARPKGADDDAVDNATVMTWLRRVARIRDNAHDMHDVLLASEALQGTAATLIPAQFRGPADALWAALPFPDKPPEARVALVFSAPAPVDPAVPFCGFVCDSWTEQLPGVTAVAGGDRKYDASEITGMAFKVDTPSATAPQTMLLAVAPDPAAGWSFDVLLDTVRETLDLAKIRPVDLGELIRFGRVLPAIHGSAGVDHALAAAAQQKVAHP
jgi:hypothetical protein